MINRELINPQSIVVVGGSNNVHKPGGRIVRNLLDGKYKGELCVVNAKETDVQGVKSYPSVHDIPETELAIISIPSKSCPEVMEVLARQKGVKAFIVISAGFGEETHEGGILEQQMLDVVAFSRILQDCLFVLRQRYAFICIYRNIPCLLYRQRRFCLNCLGKYLNILIQQRSVRRGFFTKQKGCAQRRRNAARRQNYFAHDKHRSS